MTGLHKRIDLHMQIPGHSRCLVDAGFANFKRLYRRCDADSLLDLVNQVNKSSTVNESVSYPEWTWFDWKTYFNQYYKALPGISSYQHFRIEHNRPGEVTVRKTPDGDEISFKLLRYSDTTFTAEQSHLYYCQAVSHLKDRCTYTDLYVHTCGKIRKMKRALYLQEKSNSSAGNTTKLIYVLKI
ncbi:uncharacterized protein LOC132727678 [Ruditapes philippinarum]|uniref:uncharacterized protein LOC132727678 n=1 Tax=Ruditapes philippinarum TaxID=129788 RepID=UPI00295A61C9|nr:uncharacterized protein LOC132727678 [Ruditapes philippinarum]